MPQLTAGQIVRWSLPDGSETGTATVLAIRSDQQEGLGPEAEQYAARWMDARAVQGADEGRVLTFMLGTDGRTYLDGREVHLSTAEGKA